MSEALFETLSRVYTFTIGSWPYVDNKELCPYKLAAGGYFVSKPFYLQCHVCHHGVAVPLEFDADLSETVQNVRKHKQNCIYFDNETEANQQVVDVISKEEVYLLMDDIIAKLKQSYSIFSQTKKYPVLDRQQIEKFLTEDIFTFKSIDQSYKLNWSQQIKITFFLQLFGWTISKDQHNLNAECLLCGRKVSLEGKRSIDKNQQDKSQNYSQEEIFSPVSEHRYFCMWLNPKCSGVKGFAIHLQFIFDKIIESRTLFPNRPLEETRKIRVEMVSFLKGFQQRTSDQFEKIRAIFNECQGLRNSLEKDGQSEEKMFEETEKKMSEFINDVLEEEMRGQIKKIKLN